MNRPGPTVAETGQLHLLTKKVGNRCVVTSPDEPALYVFGEDEDDARSHVPAALDMIRRMKARRAVREEIAEMARRGETTVPA